jgi:hypothetical protein
MSATTNPPRFPYTLTLFAPGIPTTPQGILMSAQMIAYGLSQEFSRLSHVTLQCVDTEERAGDIRRSDFVLIHDYFDSWVYERLSDIRQATQRQVMGIFEVAHESALIDYWFTFRPSGRVPSEQIAFPCNRSLLGRTLSVPKISRSILLDHGWIEEGVRMDWCEHLYRWLTPLAPGRLVAQLRRADHETGDPPPWVRSIREASYPSYLAETAPFETFLVTHPGSYEHSIIDMAARGSQVFVPSWEGRPFCHPSIVEELALRTFSSKAELLQLLSDDPAPPRSASRFTDMPQVVARIDAYCQRVLSQAPSVRV